MTRTNAFFAKLVVGSCMSVLMLTACEEKKTGPAVTATTPTPEMVAARLAKADAADGKTDKVVVKCAACALRMDGSPDHALVVHGYTMHFCSAPCKKSYEANPDQEIMKLPG
ncbi:MAG TPA: hypothetical protein VNT79_10900 [Phycisphaerae bacterium]|nr:hypothetical protein [Phycisphaerae bacterium]